MKKTYSDTIIIKLGGSLIVPNGGLDVEYIKRFQALIRKQIAEKNRRFFLFIGGGRLSRHYRDAGAEVTGHKLPPEELDWLGIHATRLNAQLFRTIFMDIAHPNIIIDYDTIQKTDKPVLIAAGWKPGWSTDYDAVVLAQDYNIKTLVKMSNTDYVYDKDPNSHTDAKPFKKLSWDEYLGMVGEAWTPGRSLPVDPVGAKLAKEQGVKAIYVNGKDLANVEKVINQEDFVGTVLE
ncbi:aspartate kinase [Candidatus Roizmanbacteria bacterium RIFCSPLOWO2_12_FULL_40_12]|uniref:UMP kinase n=1 Tax=Candidatus Roizmanbacteria bacterium RIFCSPLOWO2_01_FULL_40_42 TaxID=1802066 RepID=A0A1F7J359_9BACT|nr:MAG: aspartate kinase [Candidatus Roizmanbacteria bacterium RIFCSPHIGHO2_01_FULL_40_98]OGK28838.1 MAG: aspartate kinase [Candidatus Roizmanbacteria bacterium RIFCSPHIGHO2_02_FULL_40_53]OGK30368.1 MAG: aspartate kinase [Candidatus Roizmanbacteria bacterium RIFCSPHIGHO2_12_41_18]OGK37086.1 MAG: aspartate kinase [Candidatus Roizmanbacteria bacterium RIFCSPHIGHO2_12_FULL_40_130]OGK50053.1 MAG: aspartate kinase [Candidatus Roizmanbacteria bacterium RIFCSPLOWO2_01_FULL_40_42]OGK58491.1 MAG: aspar